VPAATVDTMMTSANIWNKKPSDFLSDEMWVNGVTGSFEAPFQEVDEELKGQADELATRLLVKLQAHIERKVEPHKNQHFTLKWARSNLVQLAAIMALAGHVKDEPATHAIGESLLKHPFGYNQRFFLNVDDKLLKAEGCYLYYDTINCNWIRSGKVAGTRSDPRGIGDRNEEHRKKASNCGSGSKLYIDYPARDSNRVQTARRNKVRPYPWKACFEDLALFCGIGFIRSDSVEKHLTTDYSSDNGATTSMKGLFLWDKVTVDALNRWEKNGVTTMIDKQIHMVAYLLELGYDLMLDTNWNVSTMPGFEKFGLINMTVGSNK